MLFFKIEPGMSGHLPLLALKIEAAEPAATDGFGGRRKAKKAPRDEGKVDDLGPANLPEMPRRASMTPPPPGSEEAKRFYCKFRKNLFDLILDDSPLILNALNQSLFDFAESYVPENVTNAEELASLKENAQNAAPYATSIDVDPGEESNSVVAVVKLQDFCAFGTFLRSMDKRARSSQGYLQAGKNIAIYKALEAVACSSLLSGTVAIKVAVAVTIDDKDPDKLFLYILPESSLFEWDYLTQKVLSLLTSSRLGKPWLPIELNIKDIRGLLLKKPKDRE